MKNLKLIFVLLLGIGLTFGSCKKDDDNGDDTNPTTSKTCYVVKETSDDNSYDDLIYNADNMVTKYNRYSTDGTLFENTEITYADNNISMIQAYEGSSLKSKIIFKYSNHLDSTIIYIDTLGVMTKVGYHTYTYNGDKLSSISTYFELFGQTLEVEKMQYIYSGDNVSTITKYEMGGLFTLELTSTSTFEYDDKINPYRNIGINDLLGEVQYMTKNNITKFTMKDNSGTIIEDESLNLVYEYNSDNYFTKYVQTNFDNSNTETVTIDYKCE